MGYYGAQFKGYDAFGMGFFDVKDSPVVLTWRDAHGRNNKEAIPVVNHAFKAELTSDVVDFVLKEIPREFKRSQYDHARLLILHLADGRVIAKRHNNNQKLVL